MQKQLSFYNALFMVERIQSPAFEYALEMMSKEKYKQSDLLIISDFIMDSLSESLYKKISTAKKNKNRFYSLSIGNLFLSKKLQEVFDNQWVYNPSTSNISSIQNVGRRNYCIKFRRNSFLSLPYWHSLYAPFLPPDDQQMRGHFLNPRFVLDLLSVFDDFDDAAAAIDGGLHVIGHCSVVFKRR